jgi:hypothetical protein
MATKSILQYSGTLANKIILFILNGKPRDIFLVTVAIASSHTFVDLSAQSSVIRHPVQLTLRVSVYFVHNKL